jgi:IS30 family transposase
MAKRQRRANLNASEKRELWHRWREGHTLAEIGRGLGSDGSCIRQVVCATGGFTPPERRRSQLALTLSEREEISRGVAAGETATEIARRLGRAPSTIARELGRHGGRVGYRAADADREAWDWSCRPKVCLLASNPQLRRVVATKLKDDWSPEQISGWLVTEYPDDPTMRISAETIYRSLFIQARGVLKKELLAHLRGGRTLRGSRHATKAGQGRSKIVDAVPIRDRPAAASDRAIPGNWEGDLVCGARHSQVATLVERRSRYLMLVRPDNKQSDTVVTAISRSMRRLPRQLRSTLTWDRGLELAAELDRIARRLNTRPRRTLDFATPAAMLSHGIGEIPDEPHPEAPHRHQQGV